MIEVVVLATQESYQGLKQKATLDWNRNFKIDKKKLKLQDYTKVQEIRATRLFYGWPWTGIVWEYWDLSI